MNNLDLIQQLCLVKSFPTSFVTCFKSVNIIVLVKIEIVVSTISILGINTEYLTRKQVSIGKRYYLREDSNGIKILTFVWKVQFVRKVPEYITQVSSLNVDWTFQIDLLCWMHQKGHGNSHLFLTTDRVKSWRDIICTKFSNFRAAGTKRSVPILLIFEHRLRRRKFYRLPNLTLFFTCFYFMTNFSFGKNY